MRVKRIQSLVLVYLLLASFVPLLGVTVESESVRAQGENVLEFYGNAVGEEWHVWTKTGDKMVVKNKDIQSVTLYRWNEEVALEILPPWDENEIFKTSITADDKGKLQFKVEKINGDKFDMKVEIRDEMEYKEEIAGENRTFMQLSGGGLDFDIKLEWKKGNPVTNEFDFKITGHEQLDFFYQPPLHPDHPTWADMDNDNVADTFRPSNVVGSYAVYHKTNVNNEYKTGKAFHIYRPKIIDSENNWVWGELSFDESAGILTVTIPQDWLETAKTPIWIDPTFGYTSDGESSEGLAGGVIVGSLFTSPSDVSTADNMTFYVRDAMGDDTYGKGVIVKHSDLTIINNGVGSPSIMFPYVWESSDWRTSTFSTSPSLSPSTDYILMAITSNPLSSWYFSYDSGSTNQGHTEPNSYSSPTDLSDPQHNNNKYSIYCTYTAGGAAAPEKPVLASPENDSTGTDNTPTFKWENGANATSHRLVIDNSQNFDDGDNIYDNASAWDNAGTMIENELPVDNYWWTICATNAQGDNWSENTWTFEITSAPIGSPRIDVPRVFASVYTKGEGGTIWAQVLDSDGAPVNTATVTLTVWKPDRTKYLDAVSMTFATGSDGIYNYALTAPDVLGTYLCSVKATWNGSTAYGSGEFQVASWAEKMEKIGSILDNLVAHRSAVESTISAIEGYVNGLEAGQTTIIGHVDGLASGQSTITNAVNTVIAVLGDPTDYGYTDIAHALGVIDNFVDQVEGYTDTLESGQTTIKDYTDTLESGQTTLIGYTDAVEGNQQLILDNITLLKDGQTTIQGYTDTLESGQSTITGYVDQVEGYTDQVEGWVDQIEQYMGVAAMITDTETLYNYLKNTVVPYVDQVEGYTDQIEGYVDTLESGQTTIIGHVDTLEGGQATITDYVDTLETGQSAITAKLNWIGNYLENTIKPQLNTIEGYVDSLESWSENIKDNLDLVKTRLGDPSTYGYTNVFEAINTVEGFVDEVEGYTDSLETGQTTIQNFVDTLESGQSNIFDNFALVLSNQDTIAGYTDQVEGYTDSLEGYCDEIEFYLGVAAMLTDGENLYNYLKNTLVPYVDQVEGYTDELEGYVYTLEAGQTIIKGYTDTLKAGQTSILDSLTAHRTAVESKIGDIWGWVDTLETGQQSILSDLTTLKNRVPENLSSSLDAIYGFTDQVEDYVDTLESGQTTLMGYTDTVEGNQQLILDNIDLLKQGQEVIKGYTDTLEDAQSVIQGYVDEVEFYLGVAAMQTDGENLYNYLKNTLVPYVDQVEGYTDQIEDYVDSLEAGQAEILAQMGVGGLSIEVTRYYQLSVGELQEFYVTITKGTNVDWVTITLENPKSTLVVDNASMSNPEVGSYYYGFSTSGRESGGWLATIVAKDENLTTTYRGFWRLGGGEEEAIGYLTLTILDNETDEPIEGAKIELYKAGTLVESKYTRWDGRAFLDVMNWGIHELKWSKSEYKSEVMEIDLAVSSDLTLKMVPVVGREEFPLMYLFVTIIVGGVLLIPASKWGKREGKEAGTATLIVVLLLPSLILGILWFVGVV